MRHLFSPEQDEMHFEWCAEKLQIHLFNQSGDTFVVEFDDAIIDWLLRFIWEAKDCPFNPQNQDRENEALIDPNQEDLPF